MFNNFDSMKFENEKKRKLAEEFAFADRYKELDGKSPVQIRDEYAKNKNMEEQFFNMMKTQAGNISKLKSDGYDFDRSFEDNFADGYRTFRTNIPKHLANYMKTGYNNDVMENKFYQGSLQSSLEVKKSADMPSVSPAPQANANAVQAAQPVMQSIIPDIPSVSAAAVPNISDSEYTENKKTFEALGQNGISAYIKLGYDTAKSFDENYANGFRFVSESNAVFDTPQPVSPANTEALNDPSVKTEDVDQSADTQSNKITVYDVHTGKKSECNPDELEAKRSGEWRTGEETVKVFSTFDGTESECRADELEEKRAGGAWVTANETVEIYNASTGERQECEAWDLYGKRQSGQWCTADDEVTVYSKYDGTASTCKGSEIEEKRASGVWATAEDEITVFSSVTGKESPCRADELEEKRRSGQSEKWYTANEEITVYNPKTGESSTCEAWELYGKRKGDYTGTWLAEDEEVVVYDSKTGKQSTCKAHELKQKLAGDKTGVWLTADSTVTVYDSKTGRKSTCRGDELARKKAGDKTGRWLTAEETVVLYDKNGNPITVHASEIAAMLAKGYSFNKPVSKLSKGNLQYIENQETTMKLVEIATQVKGSSNHESPKKGQVKGWGIGATAALGIAYQGQYFYVEDGYGNKAIIAVNAIGGGIGLSLDGLYMVFNNMQTIWDLKEGIGTGAGISVGPLGTSMISSGNHIGTMTNVSYGHKNIKLSETGTISLVTFIFSWK